MTIYQMTALENKLLYAGYHTAFSMQCAERSAACGVILGAKQDGRNAGYLCAAAESGIIRVIYAYTLPEYRRQGVFTELMRFIADNSPATVRVNIPENMENKDVVSGVCLKLGFRKTDNLNIFTCHRDKYPVWEQFMAEKGLRLISYLERRRYHTVSFAEASADIIEQLRMSPRTEYRNALDPALFIDIPENRLSREMSFAAVKDGRLAGYVLVTQNSPTKAVFEHISESDKETGTGLILMPFAAAMNQVFVENGIQTISYAMYEGNARANGFRNETLNMLEPEVTVSENYYLVK